MTEPRFGPSHHTPRCPDCTVPARWVALLTQPRYECPLCGAEVRQR